MNLGARGWRRDRPDAFAMGLTHDRWRGAVTLSWQYANPDLRMAGPSGAWRGALSALQRDVAVGRGQITTPTLLIPSPAGGDCAAPAGAHSEAVPGAGQSLELERDSARGTWLAAIEAFARDASPKPAARAAPAHAR